MNLARKEFVDQHLDWESACLAAGITEEVGQLAALEIASIIAERAAAGYRFYFVFPASTREEQFDGKHFVPLKRTLQTDAKKQSQALFIEVVNYTLLSSCLMCIGSGVEMITLSSMERVVNERLWKIPTLAPKSAYTYWRIRPFQKNEEAN
jgi:hypothetical protein